MMAKAGRPKRELNYELILELQKQGKSFRAIAKDLGTSHTSIRRAMVRMPDELRKLGYGERAIAELEQKGSGTE